MNYKNTVCIKKSRHVDSVYVYLYPGNAAFGFRSKSSWPGGREGGIGEGGFEGNAASLMDYRESKTLSQPFSPIGISHEFPL